MERLMKAVILAAKLREESYNQKAGKNADIKNEIVDFNTFYKLTLREACDKAAEIVGFDTQGTEPIYLLLNNSWNEALSWAKNN